MRDGNQIAIFDSGNKYLIENLKETIRGKFVDEMTLKRSNNMGTLAVISSIQCVFR